jgi:hypothetical protein
MTRRLFLGWAIGLASIVSLLPHVAYSDIYLKQKQHTDATAIMGQEKPAQDTISEVWITPERMAVSSDLQKIVINLKEKNIGFADHQAKTLMVMPLDFSGMAAAEGKGKKEQAEFKEFMGNMMSVKITVQPTNEKKKIGRWQCKKYNQIVEMRMGTIKSEIWATTEIRIDAALYAKYNASMLAQMPGFAQNLDQALSEMKKIKGVHVLSKQSTEIIGQAFSSSNELLDVKEGAAPKSAFQLPNGYSRQNLFE